MYFSSGKIRLRCRLSRNFYIRDIKFLDKRALNYVTLNPEADRGMKLSSACVLAKLSPDISNAERCEEVIIRERCI